MKDFKELFEKAEGKTLTYEQFTEAAKVAGVKLVDLSEGEYVSKNKYDADLAAKGKEIETLNGTISTRDTDLEALKQKLAEAGADATKLEELNTQFQALQEKYDNDSKAYKKQLGQQAYEFAVKEFANTKNFTSQAAKRDFIQSMIAKELKMDKGSILGAEDFATSYQADNSDAFVVATPPVADPAPATPKPQFVGSTPGAQAAGKPASLSEMMKAANENPGMQIDL